MYRSVRNGDISPTSEPDILTNHGHVRDGKKEPVLYTLLAHLRSALTGSASPDRLCRLRQCIARQSNLIRFTASESAAIDLFERASSAARIGYWQYDLHTRKMTWSRGTYDLFGFRHGREVARSEALQRYTDESLARLESIRSKAIEDGPGFGLDAEILGSSDRKRWIRISATVERRNDEPVRLFGIKQDITEDKLLLDRMRHIAEHDQLTGLASRTLFNARFADLCATGGAGGALMLIDLDGFKAVNDGFGHAVGDECLVEIGRRLSALCQSADLVARLGGDEFAVVFGPHATLQQLETLTGRILAAVEAPMICSGHSVRLGASVGHAFVDGEAAELVFSRADRALYAEKAARRRAN